jgi:threonyl-tRNA synthetase
VVEAVDSVQKILKEAGIRVKVDDSELRTPGWKFNHYEMKVIVSTLIVEDSELRTSVCCSPICS